MVIATRSIRTVDGDENEYIKDDGVEKAINENLKPPKATANPTLDPIEVARQRVDQLVSDVSDHTILELGKAAEEIQSLMQVLGDERKAITGQVQKYADFAAKAIKAKAIIAESLVRLREDRNI